MPLNVFIVFLSRVAQIDPTSQEKQSVPFRSASGRAAESCTRAAAPPREGIHRLIEHLCNLIMRTIAAVVASAGDPRKKVQDMDNLTADDVRLFQKVARRPPGRNK